ncbi:hypothetical protein YPPY34_2953, partial [Yersinia pestis PY-34]
MLNIIGSSAHLT